MNFSESLNNILQQWKKLTRPQKVASIVAPLIGAIALITIILWANRPQYVPLFTKLETSEAGAITEKLKELKVDYQLEDNGATIKVPQKDVSEIRLELANAGLPGKSTFSFDYLDQVRLGETESDRRLRYILGLQHELEKTISTLEGVEYARVHIVMPTQALFAEEQKETTAAVTIKRQYNSEMSEVQIRAIANLLAYSIEGLKPDKVTIVDTNGNVLSDVLGGDAVPGLTAGQLQIQQKIEENVQKSAQTMLDKVFGPGKTIVRASVSLDFDQRKITSQRNDEGALTSRQEVSERNVDSLEGGGVPGDPNIPGYEFPDLEGGAFFSERESVSETYQPSVTQEEVIVSPGQIRRLTVSVLADSDSITEDQLIEISGIISSATGIDENRGDEVQVARLPFNKTTQMEEQAALEEAARKERLWFYIQTGLGVLLALIALIAILRIRSRRKKQDLKELEIPEGQQLVTLEEAEQILASQMEAERLAELKLARKKVKTPEEIEKEKIREDVEKYARQNPDEVARLVKTWLAEE